jgi:hypothetical protein
LEIAAVDGKRFRAYEENITWLRANYEPLRSSHPDEFVAISKHKVLASAKTLARLLERLRKEYANDEITTFALEYVSGTGTELITL